MLEHQQLSAQANNQILLRPKQAANILNISPRTLEAWRYRGNGPKFIRISARCIRYSYHELIVWQESLKRSNTAKTL